MEASSFMVCPKCRVIFDKDYNCSCYELKILNVGKNFDITEMIEYFRVRKIRSFGVTIEYDYGVDTK